MLGSMLCEVLKDWRPTCWDRDELDITDAARVREQIGIAKPRVIINAAAYTNVDGAERGRELVFAVNAGGVKNVALAAKAVGAIVVHYSTDYVFSGDKKGGYTEDDKPGPAVNVYGESKLAGEEVLQEISPRFYLLRTAWLYGPGGNNFVDTMVKLAVKRGRQGMQGKLPVVDDQFGSPTFTKDVALATKTVLGGRYKPGVYHIVNKGVATWYEFAIETFRLADMRVDVQPVPAESFVRPARRPKYSILLNTRGPHLRSWKAALADYLGRYPHSRIQESVPVRYDIR